MDTGQVIIVDYNTQWPQMYDEERLCILDAIGEYLIDIQHVGSTSIPGMGAKPILDIMPIIRDISLVERCVDTLGVLSRRMRARAKFFTSVGLCVGFGGLFLHIIMQVVLKNIGLFDIFNATDGLILLNYIAYFLIGWIAAILGAHFGGFLRVGELSLPRLHITTSRLL